MFPVFRMAHILRQVQPPAGCALASGGGAGFSHKKGTNRIANLLGTAASNALKAEVEIHSRREIRMAEITGTLTLTQGIISVCFVNLERICLPPLGKRKKKSLYRRIVFEL